MAQLWGPPEGIPEGSDFTLEAILTLAGAPDTSRVTSSGTYTVTISDSVLNSGVALLSAQSGSFSTTTVSTGMVSWTITDAISDGWEAGTYNGDIKLVDSGGLITYWPVTMKVRTPKG